MVCEILKRRFPETDFTFTAAGIASTCSTTGAFRLSEDVLSHGPVDLFFIEFAVNDQGDAGHSRQACIRGMEGLVRQTRHHNPNADLVITYFVNPSMLAQLQSGKTPLSMGAHGDVARHYSVSTIHLAKEIAEQISDKNITWRQFGGTHPSPFGNRICAGMIDQLLSTAWKQPLSRSARPVPHALPDQPLEALHYGRGRFLALEDADLKMGWKIKIPDWKVLAGSKRSRFTSIPMLCGQSPGDEMTLKFTGTAVGAYVVAGPDAGVLEARVDDGEFQKVDLFHRFSKGLHYPRTVMFGTDLANGEHVLTLRIGAETSHGGHAARIMKFVAN
jgi:lysophospholipase L1-like esterase